MQKIKSNNFSTYLLQKIIKRILCRRTKFIQKYRRQSCRLSESKGTSLTRVRVGIARKGGVGGYFRGVSVFSRVKVACMREVPRNLPRNFSRPTVFRLVMPAYDDPVDRIHDPVDTSTTSTRGGGRRPRCLFRFTLGSS